MDQAWEILDHPADIGVRARGEDLARLFENAAAGMLGIAFDPATVTEREHRAIAAEAPDREMLLVNFLDELLWLVDGERWLPRRVSVGEICETRVSAMAFGEPRDAACHAMRTIIKAVTFHLLSVRPPPEQPGTQRAARSAQHLPHSTQHAALSTPYWEAEVYFDI